MNLNGPRRLASKADTFLMAMLSISLGVNVFLGVALKRGSLPPHQRIMGERVNPFRAKDLEGRPTSLALHQSGRPTLLYVFSPTCGWCDKNIDNINALGKSVRNSYDIVWLSLDTSKHTQDYAGKIKCQFPVYSELDSDVLGQLGLGATPETIVVGRDGKVVQAWVGAYDGQLKNEIEGVFHAKLPGLRGDVRPTF